MATVQDYFNMALSLTVGNKSGTDNYVYLPDDFRKISDLKVKISDIRSSTASAGASLVPLNVDSGASFFVAFFSHPVRIIKLTNQSLGAGDEMYSSFVAFGRNHKGTANFKNVLLQFTNDLLGPNYESTTGTGSTADVDYIYMNFTFE